MSAAYHSSICKWALCTCNVRFVFVGGGSDSSGGGFFSYYLGMFRAWQNSTRCFRSDSIEGQKEGSACYQVSLHSTVLPRTESSSSSEYSQGGHLSFSMH